MRVITPAIAGQDTLVAVLAAVAENPLAPKSSTRSKSSPIAQAFCPTVMAGAPGKLAVVTVIGVALAVVAAVGVNVTLIKST